MRKSSSILNFISRNKLCTKAISMFLALVLIFYFIPTVIYAEIADALSSIEFTDAEAETEDNNEIIYEDISKREANVKHFRLADGTYIAMQYATDVHYIGDSGSYEDIDNSLKEAAGSVYANPSSRIKFAKKTTGNGVLFTLKDGSTKLTLSLIGANKGIWGQITNYSDDENDTALGKMSKLERLTSRIIYPNILDGIDLEYIAHSLSIKENIIVKEKCDSYSYSFELKLNGMTAKLVPSGDIEITESDTGEVKYTIPAPIVYDAAYTYAPEGAATYSLTDSGNGKYTLTVNMSSEWMNDVDRAYPVTIDPTIGMLRTTMVDTHISPAAPTTGNFNTNPLRVSANHNLYFSFRSLPDIPVGSYISSATVGFTASAVTGPIKIAAYAATTSWVPGLNYNAYLNEGKGALSTTIQDMQIVSEVNKVYRFDVTDLMRGWYNGEGLYGFALKVLPNQGYTASNYVEFYSVESWYDSPQLMLTYQDTTGVEEYYSYSSHSVGLAGVGNINLATGALNFTIPTLSTTDGLMPYTVSLVYNSELAGLEYNSSNVNAAYDTERTPLGMMLSIGETIITEYFTNEIGHSFGGIIYLDSDGTENVFVCDVDDACYYDEAGARVTIGTSLSTVEYTDKNNIKRIFSKVVSGLSWHLTRIEDPSGNAVVFTLDSDFRPTAVSLDPAGDVAAIPMLELKYNADGRLSMIYNPTTYEAAVLRYSATYNGAVVTSGGKYLKGIDFARGNENTTDANWESYIASSSSMTNILHAGSASYTYNSEGYLTSVSDDREVHRLDYTLSGAKYNSITEYAGTSSSQGQSLHITYGSDYTDVISNGNDEIYGTTDDITTRYVFDDYGRAISTYSFDSDGYAIYGAVTGKYSEEEGSKNNLEQKTVLGGISVNYLYNGGFESWTSATAATGWTLSGAAVRVKSYSALLGGDYALALYPTANGSASASQTVTLDAGTYTISFPYLTSLGANATATVEINSTADTSIDITDTLNLNPTDANGIESYFSTVFEVASDNTDISITVSATNGSSAQEQLYLEIYGIMLERGIGGSDMSLVNYGSFDASSSVALSSVWTASSSLLTEDGGTPFGNVLKVNNNATGTAYVSQRIFIAPENDLYNYDYEEFYGNGGSLVVSGFAKGIDPILSAAGSFAIKVNVTYYQGTGKTDVVRTYTLAFNPALDSWQFGSITINTEKDGRSPGETGENYVDYSCIRYIDILCDYSGQAKGYALFDNISAMWDAYNTTSYKYDERGNLIEKGIGLDAEYYIYDSEDNLITYANGWGNVTKYTYSGKLPETVTEYKVTTSSLYVREEFVNDTVALTEKNITHYEYDKNGLLESERIQRNGNATKAITKLYTYDTAAGSINFGKLLTKTDEMSGTTQSYSYNSQTGLLETSLTSANNSGSGVKYGYDSLGRLVSVLPTTVIPGITVNENSASVAYTYDAYGRLSTITTESTVYAFSYDSYGNILYVNAGSTRLATYNYSLNNGKLTSVVYPNGQTEEYVYNDLEMLTEIWYNKNGMESLAHEYEYNADGTLYKYTNHWNGKATVYKYKLDGKISEISEFNTVSGKHDFSRDYFYDSNTGRISYEMFDLSYLSGTTEYTEGFEKSYAYNTDGSLKRSEFNSGITSRLKTTHWYDNYNRLISDNYTFYANNRADSFSGSEKYTYDSSGNYDSIRIKTYTVTMGSNSTVYTFTYDYRNYITSVVATGSEAYSIYYAYDDLGQLVREDNSKLNKTYIYTYDNAGNITETKAYAYTAPGTTPSGAYTTEAYTYSSSNWGDLLTAYNGTTITYDALGNPLSYYGNRSFTWEGRQMSSATTTAGNLTFKYDDNGTRVTKTKGGVTTTYYYEGTLLIAEQNANETIIYIYDDYGSVIGMQYRLTTYAEDVWDVYWFERNLQGDIVAVYNTAGTKLISYTYDAWGNFTTTYYNNGASTSAVKNPFKYRGYYYDEDLGLYYLQTRYYDSVTGRFISADDISYLGANGDLIGYNLYAYCSNNPVMYTDPSGEFTNLIIGAIAGAIVGAAVSFVSQLVDDEAPEFGTSEFWMHVGAGAVTGALSGALAASGVGIVGQIVGNAIIGAGGAIADTAISHNENTTVTDYILRGAEGATLGALSGFIGGSGSASKHVSNSFWRMLGSGNDCLRYYFSQVGREAARAGWEAIPSIIRATVPSVTKIFIKAMNKS